MEICTIRNVKKGYVLYTQCIAQTLAYPNKNTVGKESVRTAVLA